MTSVTARRGDLLSDRAMRSYKQTLLHAEMNATHGILTREEGRREGLSDNVINDRLRSGRWVRVHPEVFRVAAYPESFRGRARAALKWAGDGAFLSHDSALALEGLDGFPQRAIHITAATGGRTPGIVVHRLRRPARTRIRDGIRVCRVERALLEVCARSTAMRCSAAMDDALRKRITSLDPLWLELSCAGKGVAGCKVFRTLLEGRDHRDGKLQSKLEAKVLAVLRCLEGVEFQVQFRIEARGKNYRIDFFNIDGRLAVEAQGIRWHLGDEWLKKEWERHNNLSLAGITVLYYTWDDVHFRADDVLNEIKEMLFARSCLRLGAF